MLPLLRVNDSRARGRRALSVCTHSAHGTAGLALLSLPAATSPHAAPWTCRTCPSCAYSMIPDPVHAHDPRSNTLASATLGPLNSLRCQRALGSPFKGWLPTSAHLGRVTLQVPRRKPSATMGTAGVSAARCSTRHPGCACGCCGGPAERSTYWGTDSLGPSKSSSRAC